MNVLTAIGNITANPEVRYTEDGKAVARFSLAVARKYNRNEADFLRCTAFGKTAELLEKYTTKGSKIAVEAHVQTGSYQKDGRTVYTTDFIVDNVEFLSKPQAAEEKTAPVTDADGFMDIPDGIDEELPFM